MKRAECCKFRETLLNLKKEASFPPESFADVLKTERVADEMDVATGDTESALATKLLKRKTSYLKRIDYALDKIENNTYGICENCGDDINNKRLLARPMALLCITCKEEQEEAERKEKELQKGGFLAELE